MTTFDRLCLLRHHLLPTRVLDWSESILVALYFAVWAPRHDDCDSELWALNAYRLNQRSLLLRTRSVIATPDMADVVLRANMATFHRMDSLEQYVAHEKVEDADRLRRLLESRPDDYEAKISCPIGVFPNRAAARMKVQSSVFTVHGGKIYYRDFDPCCEDKETDEFKTNRMPSPTGLEVLSAISEFPRFLMHFTIPRDARPEIRKELNYLGIHTGMLFPELDQQALHIEEFWKEQKSV